MVKMYQKGILVIGMVCIFVIIVLLSGCTGAVANPYAGKYIYTASNG
jgi:ABC-type antimicrobial peptide transport system permease subunit